LQQIDIKIWDFKGHYLKIMKGAKISLLLLLNNGKKTYF